MDFMNSREDDSGHRGGAWKVAYADFVTALMALFIVLWLVNSGQEVRKAVAGYFKDPKGYLKLTGSARAGSGEALTVNQGNIERLKQSLEEAMQTLPGFQNFSKYVQFTVTGKGLRIELLEKDGGLFFETGSPKLTANGRRLFDLLAVQIAGLPNTIAIEGHTDSRVFRSRALEAYGNWELSCDRANAARRVMLAAGLRKEQVTEIRGYADQHTLIPGDPSDSRNRRVSVIVKYRGQKGL
jgi:chemotaxis protein MotB